MKIIIKLRNGNNCILKIDPNNLVRTLKERIEKEILKDNRIQKEDQHLIFDGITLKDENSLKYYKITSRSKIILVDKKNSLLLKSSTIFEGSSLIDRIHQSCIDLQTRPDEEDIMDLLIEAISYLDENLDYNTTNEIFSLILSCFVHYPYESLFYFQIRFQKYSITSLHLIIASLILLNFAQKEMKLLGHFFDDFVMGSFQEILRYSLQDNDANELKIFDYVIRAEYKKSYIENIILVISLTEDVVKQFYRYFFSLPISKSCLNFFIQKVRAKKLIQHIPNQLFLEEHIILSLSLDNLTYLISTFSKNDFKNVYPIIERDVIDKIQISETFSEEVLKKCIEYDIDSKSIGKLLEHVSDLTPAPIWEYLSKRGLKVTKEIQHKLMNSAMKLKHFLGGLIIDYYPKTPLLLNVLLNPEVLPPEYLSYALLNTNHFNDYETIFRNSNLCNKSIKLDVLKTEKFWDHIMYIASISEKCTETISSYLALCFTANVPRDSIVKIIDSMIFKRFFPPDKKQSDFLCGFFTNLSEDAKKIYHSEEHNKAIYYKLLEKRKHLYPSCCKLCDLDFILTFKEIQPSILYAYEFSFNKKNADKLSEIQIVPSANEPNKDLISFIQQNNNFDFITNVDNESLSLVACSLFYSSQKAATKVLGLTKENALPFFAISLNYAEQGNGNLYRVTHEMVNILIDSIIYLNEGLETPNLLLTSSLDSIVSNLDNLFEKKTFSLRAINRVLDFCCHYFVNNKYKADMPTLISAIFKLLLRDSIYPTFEKYNMHIFYNIFLNMSDIVNNEKFKGITLDLHYFDSKLVAEIFLDKFVSQEFNYDDILCTMNFYNHYCQSAPFLNFKNFDNLEKILNTAIDESKWDDLLIIYEFMNANKIVTDISKLAEKDIPFEKRLSIFRTTINLSLPSLLDLILSDTHLEKDHDLLQILFIHLMISDDSLAKYYIMIWFGKITENQKLKLEKDHIKLLEFFSNNLDKLIFSLNNCYDLVGSCDEFVKKTPEKSLPYPEFIYTVYDKLCKEKTYQSFICLQNIAASFPFLFDNDPNSIIEYVLSELNSVSNLFNEKGTLYMIGRLKKTFSALFFLFHCLYSVEFLSVFVKYIFTNITELNESQVFCMTLILVSLFQTKTIDRIIFAYSIKYDFLSIIAELHKKKISNKLFSEYYYDNLYNLASLYIKMFPTFIKNYGDLTFIEMIIKDEIENPFQNQFYGFLTILPNIIKPLDIKIPNINDFSKHIFDFITQLLVVKSNWICYEIPNSSTDKKTVEEFYKNYPTKIPDSVRTPLPIIPSKITVKMHRFLLKLPNWVVDFVEDNKNCTFPLLEEHYDNLKSVINELKKIASTINSDEDDYLYTKEFNPSTRFSSYILNEKFYNKLFEAAFTSDNNKDQIINLINDYIKDEDNLKKFLLFVKKYLTENEYLLLVETESVNRIIEVLIILSKANSKIAYYFFATIGDILIHIVLTDSCRTKELIIRNTSNLLILLRVRFPAYVSQFIAIVFGSYPDLFNQGIELFKILGLENSSNILKAIMQSKGKYTGGDLNYEGIMQMIGSVPELTYLFKNNIVDLINKNNATIKASKNEKDITNLSKQIIYLTEKVSSLMLRKATKTTTNDNLDEIDFSESSEKVKQPKLDDKENDSSTLLPAPEHLKKSSDFWDTFYEHTRETFNDMIKRNPNVINEFKFMIDHLDDLAPFNYRLKSFSDQIQTKLNSHKQCPIKISRQKILEDTFNIWVKKPDDFLNNFHITFENEKGADMGGLTREFFTLIIREIFDPKTGLFIETANNSYFTNPVSLQDNKINKQYYKMAGAFIALSLIHKHKVSAHLSLPFYRQILNQRIKFSDLEEFDGDLYKNLKSIIQGDASQLYLFFQIDENQNGKVTPINLIEDGDKVEVTNANKLEYVKLYTNYKLKKSVQEQIQLFCKGFELYIDRKLIQSFSPAELDLIICGLSTIDIDDMKENTHIIESDMNDPTVKMFFNVISNWNQEDLSRLIKFIFGTSQLGVNGFKDFCKNPNEHALIINITHSNDKYPVAHTCTRQLDLPNYDDEKTMDEKLKTAILEEDFSLL